MRIVACVTAALLLPGCAHLPPPLDPPGPAQPRGWIAIETEPGGARAVVTRAGEARLACAETPCRFALPPGAVRVDLAKLGYAGSLDALAVAGEEDRYEVELKGGMPSPGGAAFWGGVLCMLVFVPLTAVAATADHGERGAALYFAVPALSGIGLVVPQFVWPARDGEVRSHVRSPAADAVAPARSDRG